MQGSLHGWGHTGDTFSAIAVRSLRTCSVLCIASNLCVMSLPLSPSTDKACESMQYTSTPNRPLLSVQISLPQRLLLITTLRKHHSVTQERIVCT